MEVSVGVILCVPASRINLVKPGEMMNSRDNLTSFPSVGARIRAARKQAGLSQQALADLLLVSRNTVVNWEAGRCATDYKTALKLCDVLGLSPEDLSLSGGSEVFRGKSEAGTASAIPRPAPSEPYPFDSGELRFLQLYRQLSPVGRRRAQIALEAQLNAEVQARQAITVPAAGTAPGRGSPPGNVFRLFADYPGTAASGPGSEFVDTRPEPVLLRKNPRNERADAVVRVSGDSMEPVYHDGDYLYFHFTNSARSGTDVVCSTIHGAVVKRMGEDGGLYSVNPERPFQMKTEADNVRLLGVVTGVASPEDWPSPAERDELSVRFQAEERDFRRKYRLENWE